MPVVFQALLLPTFICVCLLLPRESDALLHYTSDTPGPISQILQVVWEPSSLIRFWTALDQFYNIFLGWKSAARTVASLPFREGRAMDHVKIKEPGKFQHRQMDVPHWDRFNKFYNDAESLQTPNVAESVRVSYPLKEGEIFNFFPLPQSMKYQQRNPQFEMDGLKGDQIALPSMRGILKQLKRFMPRILPEGYDNMQGQTLHQFPNAFQNGLPGVLNTNKMVGTIHNFPQLLLKSTPEIEQAIKRGHFAFPGSPDDLKKLQSLTSMIKEMSPAIGTFQNKDITKISNGANTLLNGHGAFPQVTINQKHLPSHMLNLLQASPLKHLLLPQLFPNQETFIDYNSAFYQNNHLDFLSGKKTTNDRNVHFSTNSNLLDRFPLNNNQATKETDFRKKLDSSLMFLNSNVPDSNPEARLRMFLKLMGQLGKIHTSNVNRVKFDDDQHD